MSLRRAQQRLMAGGVVDPYAALRAAWDTIEPTLLYSAPRQTGYSQSQLVPSATNFGIGAYPATQDLPGNQPTYAGYGINDRPSFYFDGSDYLHAAYAPVQPYAIFLVVRPLLSDRYYTAWQGNTTYIREQGGSYVLNAGNSISGGSPNLNPRLLLAVVNGASSSITVDGAVVATGDAGSLSTSAFVIGRYNSGLVGHISEAALISGVLSSELHALLFGAASNYFSIPLAS